MRRALGIDEPNFGTLWAYMRADDGLLDMARLIHPKAEPEFAFLADTTLRGADVTAEAVAGAGRWAVALEVVDPRWVSYDFDWLDNTADGSSAAAYVVGAFHRTTVSPESFRLPWSRERSLAAAPVRRPSDRPPGRWRSWSVSYIFERPPSNLAWWCSRAVSLRRSISHRG